VESLCAKPGQNYAEEEETYLHIILWLGVSGPFPASPSNNTTREVRSEIGRGQVLSLRNVVFGIDTISFDQRSGFPFFEACQPPLFSWEGLRVTRTLQTSKFESGS
jgi:hypothetical protein